MPRLLSPCLSLAAVGATASVSAANGALSSCIAPQRVCVIGAGAAGLACATALQRAGLPFCVFEQRNKVGGIWSRTQSPGAFDNPVYDSLSTNLPKEIMAYSDFPFDPSLPSFVRHEDVQEYLEQYASHHELGPSLRLRTTVLSVRRQPDGAWRVRWTKRPRGDEDGGGGGEQAGTVEAATATATATATVAGSGEAGDGEEVEELFSAVLVANGHFHAPVIPRLAGRDEFERAGGQVVHSSLYRAPPDEWRGKRVVVIGSGPSGTDISLELADAGCDVTISIRAGPDAFPQPPSPRLRYARRVSRLNRDLSVTFDDGTTSPPVAAVLLATGYDYAFPFLESDLVTVSGVDSGVDNDVDSGVNGSDGDSERDSAAAAAGEKRVGPLYKQLFSTRTPTLAFIGLPFKVVPFPLCEAQAALVAAVLTRTATLPPAEQQEAEAASELAALRRAGGRNLHMLGDAQWGYVRELIEMRGDTAPKRLRLLQRLNAEVSSRRRILPLTYRQSNYRLYFDDADEEGGGYWTVDHPTHPLTKRETCISAEIAPDEQRVDSGATGAVSSARI